MHVKILQINLVVPHYFSYCDLCNRRMGTADINIIFHTKNEKVKFLLQPKLSCKNNIQDILHFESTVYIF